MSRLILVGGGLANSLIACRLQIARPDLDLVLVEREASLGGNHVWCFHQTDVSAEQHRWLEPFVERSWPSHEVRFPRLKRQLAGGYHAITSDRLHQVATSSLGVSVRTGTEVSEITPTSVRLADGTTIEGDAVLDGRGDPGNSALQLAYQKFVGQWIELDAPHGLTGPILMDATVEQQDGFRFIYTLPFGERLLHVEDTRYSDTPELDQSQIRDEIARYAQGQGWSIACVRREEHGVLPITLGGDIERFWESGPGVPRSGLRAGLFHATTGYSLPEAVRMADALVQLEPLDAATLFSATRKRSRELWERGRYFRLLNRMLFHAAKPHERYRVLERFYRLGDGLIQRFYAGKLTAFDRIRILVGKPPVPVGRALRCLGDPTTSAPRAGRINP